MKKLAPVRSPLAGFLLGVLFCAVGMSIILYLGWGYLKNALKEESQNTEITIEQPNQGEIVLPQTDADGNVIAIDNEQLPDGMTKPPLEGDDGLSASVYSDGKLGVAQGAGGTSHLKKVSGQYTNKEEMVHKNVHMSLMNMIFAAKQDGVSLTLVSAFRSYNHQKRIWENKWANTPNGDTSKAKNILRYSSFPGTSRHHWGTDVDFNSVSLSYWKTGEGKRVHNWLVKNGPQFGFCEIYAPGRGGGYSDEPWHWTHAPTANQFYSQMSNPSVLNIALSQDIKGAAAVRQMPDHMMSYVTSVSGCRGVSSAPQQANYPTEAPRSGNKIPLHEETPLNNPKLKASLSPHASFSANNNSARNNPAPSNDYADKPIYSDDTLPESNPKPPLPKGNGPIFQKQNESSSNARIESQNGIKIVKGAKLD